MSVRPIAVLDETVDASTFNRFAGLAQENVYDVPREKLGSFAFAFAAFPHLFSHGFVDDICAMFSQSRGTRTLDEQSLLSKLSVTVSDVLQKRVMLSSTAFFILDKDLFDYCSQQLTSFSEPSTSSDTANPHVKAILVPAHFDQTQFAVSIPFFTEAILAFLRALQTWLSEVRGASQELSWLHRAFKPIPALKSHKSLLQLSYNEACFKASDASHPINIFQLMGNRWLGGDIIFASILHSFNFSSPGPWKPVVTRPSQGVPAMLLLQDTHILSGIQPEWKSLIDDWMGGLTPALITCNPGKHWVLAYVDFKLHDRFIFDSLPPSRHALSVQEKHVNSVLKALTPHEAVAPSTSAAPLHFAVASTSTTPQISWKTKFVTRFKQLDGNACGAATIMHAALFCTSGIDEVVRQCNTKNSIGIGGLYWRGQLLLSWLSGPQSWPKLIALAAESFDGKKRLTQKDIVYDDEYRNPKIELFTLAATRINAARKILPPLGNEACEAFFYAKDFQQAREIARLELIVEALYRSDQIDSTMPVCASNDESLSTSDLTTSSQPQGNILPSSSLRLLSSDLLESDPCIPIDWPAECPISSSSVLAEDPSMSLEWITGADPTHSMDTSANPVTADLDDNSPLQVNLGYEEETTDFAEHVVPSTLPANLVHLSPPRHPTALSPDYISCPPRSTQTCASVTLVPCTPSMPHDSTGSTDAFAQRGVGQRLHEPTPNTSTISADQNLDSANGVTTATNPPELPSSELSNTYSETVSIAPRSTVEDASRPQLPGAHAMAQGFPQALLSSSNLDTTLLGRIVLRGHPSSTDTTRTASSTSTRAANSREHTDRGPSKAKYDLFIHDADSGEESDDMNPGDLREFSAACLETAERRTANTDMDDRTELDNLDALAHDIDLEDTDETHFERFSTRQETPIAGTSAIAQQVTATSVPVAAPKLSPLVTPMTRTHYEFQPIELDAQFPSLGHLEHCLWQSCVLEGHVLARGRSRSGTRITMEWVCSLAGVGQQKATYTSPESQRPSRQPSKKCGCDFLVTAQFCKPDHWQISRLHWAHNGHVPLNMSDPDDGSRTIPLYRLPESYGVRELLETAMPQTSTSTDVLAPTVAKLFRAYPEFATVRTILIDATEVYNYRSMRSKELTKDLQEKFQVLDPISTRFASFKDKNPSFDYAFRRHRATGKLCEIAWLNGFQKDMLNTHGSNVQVDATYKVCNTRMILVQVHVTTNRNVVVVVFQALVSHETTDVYEWVIETMVRLSGCRYPDTYITDRCAALIAAISSVYGRLNIPVAQQFCVFHIAKNLADSIRRSGALWSIEKATLMYRDFRFTSALRTEEAFLFGMNKLKVTYATNNRKLSDFLDKLIEERPSWALYVRFDSFNFGDTTTSKAEAGNRGVKRFGRIQMAKQTLQYFLDQSESFNSFQQDRVSLSLIKGRTGSTHQRGASRTTTIVFKPMEVHFASIFTPYCCSVLKENFVDSGDLRSEAILPQEAFFQHLSQHTELVQQLVLPSADAQKATKISKQLVSKNVRAFATKFQGDPSLLVFRVLSSHDDFCIHYVVYHEKFSHFECTCRCQSSQGFICPHFFKVFRDHSRTRVHHLMISSHWKLDTINQLPERGPLFSSQVRAELEYISEVISTFYKTRVYSPEVRYTHEPLEAPSLSLPGERYQATMLANDLVELLLNPNFSSGLVMQALTNLAQVTRRGGTEVRLLETGAVFMSGSMDSNFETVSVMRTEGAAILDGHPLNVLPRTSLSDSNRSGSQAFVHGVNRNHQPPVTLPLYHAQPSSIAQSARKKGANSRQASTSDVTGQVTRPQSEMQLRMLQLEAQVQRQNAQILRMSEASSATTSVTLAHSAAPARSPSLMTPSTAIPTATSTVTSTAASTATLPTAFTATLPATTPAPIALQPPAPATQSPQSSHHPSQSSLAVQQAVRPIQSAAPGHPKPPAKVTRDESINIDNMYRQTYLSTSEDRRGKRARLTAAEEPAAADVLHTDVRPSNPGNML